MICKNESALIREALLSVRPFIDAWCVLDTGSTDGTQDIVKEEMRDLPGCLYEFPWQGWDKSRTMAIDLAKAFGSDFIFILDADERVISGTLPSLDPNSAYWCSVKFGDSGMVYSRPNILSRLHNWHYVGVTHEYLTPEPDAPPQIQSSLVIQTHPSRANKSTERCLEDAKLLEAEFTRDPSNPRTVFYLAQSYKDAGMPEEAITTYQLRAAMGGWYEEVYISLLRVAQLMCHRRSFPEVAAAFAEAHKVCPHRAGETLGYLADFCRWWADNTKFPKDDRLFVDASRYKK
jgi:glycosyltransferase involved in cell wall biosynthesis